MKPVKFSYRRYYYFIELEMEKHKTLIGLRSILYFNKNGLL